MELLYISAGLFLTCLAIAVYVGRTTVLFYDAASFLLDVTKQFEARVDHQEELNDLLTKDLPTIKTYIMTAQTQLFAIIPTVVLNIAVFLTTYFEVQSDIMTVLYVFTAFANASTMVNALNIRKCKWHITGVCAGYGVLVESLEYIDSGTEEK